MKTGLLIVGSDSLTSKNLKSRMEIEGFKVYLSNSLPKITLFLKRQYIRVVLLNIVDLNRNGLKFLKAIKNRRSSVEVILINHPDSVDLSIEGMKLGAFDDFYLPLEMNMLIERIKEAVQKAGSGMKTKKSFQQKYEELVIAISLAEGGAPDMAHDYLNRPKRENGD